MVKLRKTSAISTFSNITRVIYLKNCPNQTYSYRLITPNQHFLLKLIFLQELLCTIKHVSSFKNKTTVLKSFFDKQVKFVLENKKEHCCRQTML